MGVAPAGVTKPNSGHFHLLIDAEQPALDRPIPNDENHLHYGAGQTEATISLPPGKHTLQLLMGDANHVPHSPPVMSPVYHVTVAEPAATPAPAAGRGAERRPSPKNARVYIESPANGAYVPTTFTVHFGLAGMGVAPAGFDKPNTGHHHLIVDAPLPPFDRADPQRREPPAFRLRPDGGERHLAQGQAHPADAARRRRHIPHDPPLYSQPIVVYVGMTPPRPVMHYHKHHRYYYR